MRTIEFRGKETATEQWIYGYYVKDPIGKSRIYYQPFPDASSNTYHFVHPETVGQFTGLTDKNGTKIFEGDRITDEATIMIVKYINGAFYATWGNCKVLLSELTTIQIIHDNTELLPK